VRLERRDWAGLVVALAIAAACVRLGFWQLDRLGQRRARNAAARAARAQPPLAVTGSSTVDSALERRVHARGLFDYVHEQLWHGRAYEGVPGVDLITPLRLADGAAVLVDRGWAPSPDGYHVDQGAYREADTADVLGLGMPAPRARGDVDPARLRDSVPYPLLPFVIQQLPSSTALGREPPSPAARPLRWPAPELSDGPHLSYTIQWFSFAAIILVGSWALARKRAREGGVPQGYH
jgi:surfeit locus 1 family protein